MLQRIARHAARDLGLPCVLITRLDGPDPHPELAAFSIQGRARSRFDYHARRHPCPYQEREGDCDACGASHQYPACLDVEHQCGNRFIGRQIRSGTGQLIGHIAAFDHQAIADPQALEPRLEYHAATAAVVLAGEETNTEREWLLPALGLLSDLATRLLTLNGADLEDGITEVLASVAGFFGADRACLYHLDEDRRQARLRYLWNHDSLWRDLPGEVFSTARFPWLMSRLDEGRAVVIHDTREPEQGPEAREGDILSRRGVGAFIDIPLFHDRRLSGFIGLDCRRPRREWSRHAPVVLRGVGRIISAALREREREQHLQRELHHRMKNQLQGLAGLLRESGRRHPEVRTLLQDSIGRIHTIALFNEQQLHQPRGGRELASLLRELARCIEQTHGVRVHQHIEAAQGALRLDHDRWSLLGLVLNELLSNAARHGRGGKIRLRCEAAALTTHITLVIENAAGALPPGLDLVLEKGLGQGLSLVLRLLPEGCTLQLRQRAGWVSARLNYAYSE